MPPIHRTVAEFSALTDEAIAALVGALNAQVAESYTHHWNTQTRAWIHEIQLLRTAASTLLRWGVGDALVVLEYEIPRRRRRPDVLIVSKDGIVVIEFKVGVGGYDASARWQLAQYVLDLRDFHSECREIGITGVLVATRAANHESGTESHHGVEIALTNGDGLSEAIIMAISKARGRTRAPIEPENWLRGSYKPTPNIIEAACQIYEGHDVSDISHAYAENLTATTDAIVERIIQARADRKRVICFVTGVPGAGKTLTGLDALHDPRLRVGEGVPGVFLSGNLPLVEVLGAALARASRGAQAREGRRLLSARIDNVHKFVPEYAADPQRIPHENLIVFDEAQRAWSRDRMIRKNRGAQSEAEEIIEIMERQPEWCVVVALVGGGQEIHDGEAGLAAWGDALAARPVPWLVVASPEVLQGGTSVSGHRLFGDSRASQVEEDSRLHLHVSVRAPRARILAEWVEAVLTGAPQKAEELVQRISEFPIVLTRDLRIARTWLRARVAGDDRIGLVASAGARRLRGYGVQLSTRVGQNEGIAHWFLAPGDDVRSSNYLEVAATEFECQGLELDYVGLCWGDDLTRAGRGWDYRRFAGTDWRDVLGDQAQKYMINKYRVLMTRARRGMVIWVPPGSVEDETREITRMDRTAEYLRACGLRDISAEVVERGAALAPGVRFVEG